MHKKRYTCNKQKQNKAVIYGLSKQYQVKTKTNYDTDEQQLWPSYVIMKYSSRKIDKSFVDKKIKHLLLIDIWF